MSSQSNHKSISIETPQEIKRVEYYNYFFTHKDKKLTSKDFAEKTAILNSYFFDYIKGFNIPTAFLKKENSKSLQLIKTDEFPFRIKIINSVDARTSKIFSVKVGSNLQLPILEYHFGEMRDSLITESHIISFNLCSYDELKFINRLCSKINAIVKSFFERRNISLLELTCRFGKFESKIFLIDDFSPLSLKILSNKSEYKLPDPYKIETSAQMNKYSDFLIKLTSGN